MLDVFKSVKISQTNLMLLGCLAVVLLVIFFTRGKKKQENFSFGSIFGKIKDVAVNVGKTTAGVATGAFDKVTGKTPSYSPTWGYRTWNGRSWECPNGSVDYGKDDQQCLTSTYGPQIWRADASGTWGWSCPKGMAPNNSDDWNAKCMAGYSDRRLISGQWRCTDTETDTGRTWDNSDWFTAQQQCKRGNTVFTTRMNIDGKWQCPPDTTDTGFTWSDGDNGAKQCQYNSGTKLHIVSEHLTSVDIAYHEQHDTVLMSVDNSDGANSLSYPVEKFPDSFVCENVLTPEGSGEEVLLQGFNWESWHHDGGWYNHIRTRAKEFADAGITAIWLPPPTQSVSSQGYMPGDLYNLNSKYGSEEDLVKCIIALHSVGIKAICDAVINHRCAQFQDEHGTWNKYGGKLAWDSRAIVSDDANFRGRGNRSSGELFSAAPNIDHSQHFVKNDLKDWLTWLRAHIGFDGWRLDFVRGFDGSHVKDYMNASVPQFAVGEYWDALSYDWNGTPDYDQNAHRQRIVNWIDSAGGLAMAFDFTLKGVMHAAFDRCEYWRLKDKSGKPSGVLGWWPSRAVTFLDNHDTGSTQGHWRFPNHAIEQGYAYTLTHPGTPCVFWDHMCDKRTRDAISKLISIRKHNGITCNSKVTIMSAERDVYTAVIDGKTGKVFLKIGSGNVTIGDEWKIVGRGNNWAVWEK